MNAFEIRERIRAIWTALEAKDRWALFKDLADEPAKEVFVDLDPVDQAELLALVPLERRRELMLALPPDDAVDLLQAVTPEQADALQGLLEPSVRQEVEALRNYPPDQAGGLMTTRFLSLNPHKTVKEALAVVRQQARSEIETLSNLYITDERNRLVGVMPLQRLLASSDEELLQKVMEKNFLSASVTADQEEVAWLFQDNGLSSLAVVDSDGVLKGIVTFDDMAEAVEDEVTEDMQKMGGVEALDAPYLRVSLSSLIQKRGGWLAVLFLGEMLTATAMGYYEGEIAKAVVLAIFIPLIISSGGNSGSQASTLIIRAMALDEIRLSDWFRVIGRELVAGLCLGALLGAIGFTRIMLWQQMFGMYDGHAFILAVTIGLSLVGVVLFGTLSGAMLPFILRRIGFDPASASAPFVATLVDVTGLIIYFSVAKITLDGVLL